MQRDVQEKKGELIDVDSEGGNSNFSAVKTIVVLFKI